MTAVTLLSLAGAALPVGPATAAVTGVAADPTPAAPKKLFTIRDQRVDESSGLAKSQKYEGIWWTVNDSGDSARVFGINASGKVKAVLEFKAPVKDVEAISVDRDGTIYIADIGDNRSTRDTIEVYTIPEPDELTDQSSVKYRRYDFAYPDGAHDAETLLVEPETRRLYFVTKVSRGKGGIYAAPEESSREGTNDLTKIAEAPSGITDGTFLPDGKQVVLRTYVDIATVAWGEKPNVVARAAAPLAQGESVAVGPTGSKSVLVGSEGQNSAVYQMPVPARKPAAQPSATPTPKPAAADTTEPKKNHNLRWIVIGAGLFALIITVVTFPPGRRERQDRQAENDRLTGQAPPTSHSRRRTPV
ncbi:esterase-like activity of phytase family protein [Kribbella amoyensis]|uniref:esterase-like activity of phytase family protein n=1 Tax=Kribbella amoyensis TaxID=996641 RepID=UPI001EE195FF|nr:esterase-like activity of phytase family protein [Kribbella amoyensis]